MRSITVSVEIYIRYLYIMIPNNTSSCSYIHRVSYSHDDLPILYSNIIFYILVSVMVYIKLCFYLNN